MNVADVLELILGVGATPHPTPTTTSPGRAK